MLSPFNPICLVSYLVAVFAERVLRLADHFRFLRLVHDRPDRPHMHPHRRMVLIFQQELFVPFQPIRGGRCESDAVPGKTSIFLGILLQ